MHANWYQLTPPVNFGKSGDPDQQWNEEGCCLATASLSHTNDVTIL